MNKDLETAREKEERLSSEIEELKIRCSELSKYENIANIEKEKEKTVSFINEQKTSLRDLFSKTKFNDVKELSGLDGPNLFSNYNF